MGTGTASLDGGSRRLTFMYHTAAMFHTILSLREEGAAFSTQNREQQVANFVGPTLAELGLARWMATHGGMVTNYYS